MAELTCPVISITAARLKFKKLNLSFKSEYYEMIFNKVMDYLVETLGGGALDEISDAADIAQAMVAAVVSAINGINTYYWGCYIISYQLDIMKASIKREDAQITAILSCLKNMKRLISVPEKSNTRLSEMYHFWLKSAFLELNECYNSVSIPRDFMEYYNSSHNKIKAAEAILGLNNAPGIVKGIAAALSNYGSESYGGNQQGLPIKPPDYNKITTDLLNKAKGDMINQLDFTKVWGRLLSLYVIILKTYMGVDINGKIKPFLDYLDQVISNMASTSIADWNINKLGKGLDWTKTLAEISKAAIMPNDDTDNVIGNRTKSSGSKLIIDIIMAVMIPEYKYKSGDNKNISNRLKAAVIGLQEHKTFLQIISNGDTDFFTPAGKNTEGNLLIDGRVDKLTQKIKIKDLDQTYKWIEDITITNAIANLQELDYFETIYNTLKAIQTLMAKDISGYNYSGSTGPHVSDFLSLANINGIGSMIKLASYVGTGFITKKYIDEQINYFETRKQVINDKYKIIASVPQYENATIDNLIESMRNLGMGTLVDNILSGALFELGGFAEASKVLELIGAGKEMLLLLDRLQACKLAAKSQKDRYKMTEIVDTITGDSIVIANKAKRTILEGIVNIFGVSWASLARNGDTKDEMDEQDEGARALMDSIV